MQLGQPEEVGIGSDDGKLSPLRKFPDGSIGCFPREPRQTDVGRFREKVFQHAHNSSRDVRIKEQLHSSDFVFKLIRKLECGLDVFGP